MNKTMFRDFRGKETLNGFLETVRWKLTSYYGGPEKSGEYFVSNGDGHVELMHCTGDTKDARSLFGAIMDGYYENVRFSDGRSLTDKDLLDLYRSYYVWYIVEEGYEMDYGCREQLMIMTDEDEPKYFMESKITGPVDSEMDNYETTYYEFDDKCNEFLVK